MNEILRMLQAANAPLVNEVAPAGFGASRTDWMTFTFGLGLDEDLLPVVSNPGAVIAPRPESTLTTIGKVPSQYNSRSLVIGIKGWTRELLIYSGGPG